MSAPKLGAAAAVERRRGGRVRKVSERIGKVSEADQRQAIAARLDALENDGVAPDTIAPPDVGAGGNGSDDEFQASGDTDAGGEVEEPRGSAPSKAKRRSRSGAAKKRGSAKEKDATVDGAPQSFAQLLSEAALHDLPPGRSSYLTAAAGPPVTRSARKFCSVCGNLCGYNCTRCKARFCSRKCLGVHTETRCLKFMS